ncbi:Holliday junction resolvase RuvX [Trueperella pyogenes]|uniref:Putative pre-16S rRNA nuclease n=1 Tax=Trueperella pyogenes TaxID=1661 RepID=A0ABV3NBY2_9ACTO|nr:Holliday junction resolvase RuvX [Trueperella pyogenes]AHU88784.1 Holliday junction resolvase [Trueperella pyogenes]AZR03430.1 Holliday junction resolvase RuvX [Trueperella pyogenes]OQD39777.1 Holliday junction resolvase RuvX [Trueperella pyogenes]OQD40088.1 Holliday junction resolvase RuvX [Trueperella pyogenes]OQD40381.1 Holliday junction resolvase RuvX [Trueperella pyogenes]
MRKGVRFGVDVGAARIGVARSDSSGILATPVATLRAGKGDIDAVAKMVREAAALEVIVGLPLNMDGTQGKSAFIAKKWARRLSRRICPVPVRMLDERLTTVQAHRQLHDAGRKEISHRAVVDQAAAVIILESALEQERVSGRLPALVETTEG